MPDDELTGIQTQLREFQGMRSKQVAGPRHDRNTSNLKTLLRRGKAIYGPDTRMDVAASTVPVGLTQAVCVIFETTKLRRTPGGYTLQTQSLGAAYRLCSGQPFENQPVLGFATGFLVAPDIVATAGHAAESHPVADIAFKFDFEMTRDGSIDNACTEDSVYFGAEILSIAHTSGAEDFALIRLNRPVKGVKPLDVTETNVSKDDKVYVVGHPLGLPKKVALDAWVTDDTPPAYFVTNLDTFGGNSGSPVLDKQHRVRGILVRGDTDFVQSGDCCIAATFPIHKGGEHVCRASLWIEEIPTTRGDRTKDVIKPSLRERAPDPRVCRKSLGEYLLSAYSVDEVRRLICYSIASSAAQDLQWNNPPSQVVFELVAWLQRHKHINKDFFDILRNDRPNRTAQVGAVELCFLRNG